MSSEGSGHLKLTVIAALNSDYVIGKEGKLPWHIPGDLKRFKKRTLGGIVLMGRRTWESLGRPLPGRENMVVSRSIEAGFPIVKETGVVWCHSPAEALAYCKRVWPEKRDCFILGGGQLYSWGVQVADELDLTWVSYPVLEPDTYFPRFTLADWAEQSREDGPSEGVPYFSQVLKRKTPQT